MRWLKNILPILVVISLACGAAHATRGIVNPRGITAETTGALPVAIQDQTTAPLFVLANQVTNTTTLAAEALIDASTITVAATTGIAAGSYIGLFSTDTNRFYQGKVVSIASAPAYLMDTPLDSTFAIGDTVGVGISNMAVNGAVTPQVFSVRGADPGIDLTVDITRIIITCIDDTAVDLTTFCGGVALTNGLVMRRTDGTTINFTNWKTNQDIAAALYDWTVYAATNPQQGVDGMVARLTFGGQSKIGVVVRIAAGEELEWLIQDDLSGITKFEIMVEGHVVQE